jgi:hypothetical protein
VAGRARPLERAADRRQPRGVRARDEARLERQQPLQEGVRLVLEGEDHRASAGADDVADHLHGHRRLAETLWAAEQYQLTGPEPALQRVVEHREPGRDHGGAGTRSSLDRVVGPSQEIGDRAEAAV